MKIRHLAAAAATAAACASLVNPLAAHADSVIDACADLEHGMDDVGTAVQHPPFLRVDDTRYNIERWNSPVETDDTFFLEGCAIDSFDENAGYERFVISATVEADGTIDRPVANHGTAPRTSVDSSEFDIVDDPNGSIYHYGGYIIVGDADGADVPIEWHYYPDGM